MSESRRSFLKVIGATGFAAGVTAELFDDIRASRAGFKMMFAAGAAQVTSLKRDLSFPVRVNNPRTLKSWELPAERILIGEGYKPCLALLPNGELVMVSLLMEDLPGKKRRERTPMWSSTDGGMTWSGPVIVEDMIGREQWLTCTSNGTLFATCHLLVDDVNNPHGFVHSYLHRSTDYGKTWQRTRILLEGHEERKGTTLSRNVVELPDKTLLLGVSIQALNLDVGYLWSSQDNGETWNKSLRVEIPNYGKRPYDNLDGFFSEDFTYRNHSGKLLHFVRCGPPSPMYPIQDGREVPKGDDGIDRMLLCESVDEGRTWVNLRDFGDYGMHYPRVLRLQDRRLLLTFTQRSTFYPIGLQAVLSHDDGETWSLSDDRITIEGKTPWGMPSGGGFGNTVQLPDGGLVSCYSFRSANNKTYIEVVRWILLA